MDWLDGFLEENSYWGLFIALIACGLGLPVPEDIILITGGVLAAPHTRTLLITIGVCMVGVLGGDSIIFSLGHRYRESILKAPPFKWLVTPPRLKKIRSLYKKYGYWAIFLSRFLAGLRATSFLMAGISQVPYRVFILADGVAALISVPFFIWLGFHFADNIEELFESLRQVESIVAWGMGAVVIVLILRYWAWPRIKRLTRRPEV